MSEAREAAMRSWVRIAAGCMVLIGVAFIQQPGYLVPDTKFDLVMDPSAFLGRAVHLWDPSSAFGQLQNQAYGYLWPMGPFFLLGSVLDLPGWVVQRLWMALVMCVAFVGSARLARALGVRSDVAALVGAAAYALSPRMLSTLGPISIEAWPSAVAPWVLLPLVIGATRGSPRRAAFLSAVAISMVGGVNAAATSAVLPLGVIWLLTRQPGPRRRRLMLWWPIFTALGTLWWLVPLFVMGAYGPPFLDFIESASVTTMTGTIFDALRGTTAWVPYIDGSWQGGNVLVSEGYLALNSAVILLLGLMGIAMRANPHRQFLFLSVLVGLFLVTMGHLGSPQGWLAGPLHDLLDGVLAPLRNVHKFDPVVRLPMVLGLTWLIEVAVREGTAAGLGPGARAVALRPHHAIIGLAVLVVVGASAPAGVARLASPQPVLEVPEHWSAAVSWLEARDAETVALLAPGSGFADYGWGAPRDEPMQFLAKSPWAVRNAIPLAPPGNIRMLDAFEERLQQGRGSTGLAPFLRRAGIEHIVVRNDLAAADDIPAPLMVRSALAQSPGIRLAASFGPLIGGGGAEFDTDAGRAVVNGGRVQDRAAIEVYEVEGDVSGAVATDGMPVVVGGPEDLLRLADAEVLGDQPTQLAVDADPDTRPEHGVVLTDGYLDRERTFGRVHDAYSPVRVPGAPRRSGNPTRDYLLGEDGRWQTTGRILGASAVEASSSMSDATAFGGSRPAEGPLAALDGDPGTHWVSGAFPGSSPWWQVDFTAPRELSEVTITLGDGGSLQSSLRVVTEHGPGAEIIDLRRGESRTVDLGDVESAWLRIEEASGSPQQTSLAEVVIPGLEVRKELVLPTLPKAWGAPDVIALQAIADARTGCLVVAGRTSCLESEDVGSVEEQQMLRSLTLPEGAAYRLDEIMARPRFGPGLLDLVQSGLPIQATASSTGPQDVRASAVAAIDGDPGTAWSASLGEENPELRLNWLGTRTVREIRVDVADGAPVRRPTQLTVVWPGGSQRVEIDSSGVAEVKPFRTDQLALRFTDSGRAVSIDRLGNFNELPVGASEVEVVGAPELHGLPDRVMDLPCGSGPDIEINGTTIRTAVSASRVELASMRPVAARPCRDGEPVAADEPFPVELSAGGNRVALHASPGMAPSSLTLVSGSLDAHVFPAHLDVTSTVEQQMTTTGDASVLVRRQNYNPGWSASQAGQRLEPVVVDGWQQGWRLEGATGPVTATFTPDVPYRIGLGAGLVCLLALVGLLLVPRRRWPDPDLPHIGQRPLPAPVLLGGIAAAGGLLAGWLGLLAAGAGASLASAARRRFGIDAAWVFTGLMLIPGVAYFLRPWGSPAGWAGDLPWPHYVVVFVLGATAAFVPGPLPRRFRWRRDMKGSSTTR